MNKEEKEAIEILKDNIGILEGKLTIKYTNYNTVKAYNTILNLIDKQQQKIEELKEDLKYVLNQTLGAFEKNWCIDWNFTEIREKYNLESEE